MRRNGDPDTVRSSFHLVGAHVLPPQFFHRLGQRILHMLKFPEIAEHGVRAEHMTGIDRQLHLDDIGVILELARELELGGARPAGPMPSTGMRVRSNPASEKLPAGARDSS